MENRVGTGASIQIWQETVAPIGVMAKAELPEVTDYVRITGTTSFNYLNTRIRSLMNSAPTLLIRRFLGIDFNLVKGNQLHPFVDDHSMVITESRPGNISAMKTPWVKSL